MQLIRSVKQMQKQIRLLRCKGKTIGFVPTMGYLHAGHISLALRSIRECDITIMSIYVNPKQFAINEDLNKYPRNLKNDIRLAKNAGVDF